MRHDCRCLHALEALKLHESLCSALHSLFWPSLLQESTILSHAGDEPAPPCGAQSGKVVTVRDALASADVDADAADLPGADAASVNDTERGELPKVQEHIPPDPSAVLTLVCINVPPGDKRFAWLAAAFNFWPFRDASGACAPWCVSLVQAVRDAEQTLWLLAKLALTALLAPLFFAAIVNVASTVPMVSLLPSLCQLLNAMPR